jgi:hypothetical protein
MSDDQGVTPEQLEEARRDLDWFLARLHKLSLEHPADAKALSELSQLTKTKIEEVFTRYRVRDAAKPLIPLIYPKQVDLEIDGWVECEVTAKASSPPRGACYLLDLLLAKADRETIPGDLVEEFETSILPKYGPRQARFWFWAQAMRAIAERNRLSRWVLVYGLGRVAEWIFKAIGS